MSDSLLGDYFDVITQPQTYLNIVYLLLAFPLGVAYFVILITGFSLGMGLLILGIGILILAALMLFNWTIAVFERQMAIALLHVSIPVLRMPATDSPRLWERIRAYLVHPVTWKSMLHNFLKFPLGIFSFVLSVALLAVSVSMIFAPLTYENLDMHFADMYVDTIEEAVALCFVGILLLPAALHILNFIAKAYGEVARVLLSSVPQR